MAAQTPGRGTMSNETHITTLVIDARGWTTGAAQVERAAKQAGTAVDQWAAIDAKAALARERSTATLRTYTDRIDKVQRDYDRWRGSVDQVAAAEIKAAREITRAHQQIDAAVV